MSTILDTIVEEKKREIARLPSAGIARLKITGFRPALLINLNSRLLKDGVKQLIF